MRADHLTNVPTWDQLKSLMKKKGAEMAENLDKPLYDDLFVHDLHRSKIPEFLFPFFGDISWSGEQSLMCLNCDKMIIPATLNACGYVWFFCPDCHLLFRQYKVYSDGVPVRSEF